MTGNLLAPNATFIDPHNVRLGWTSAPNQRGTIDILWSCLSALLLALWTMLHLNVPAETDTWMTVFWRKLRWLILGVLAPELPMLFACAQYASAKRSVADFAKLGYTTKQWSLCHGFCADSGGYVLQPLYSQSFPITAKQLHYLVQHGYVSIPKTTRREIWDKSKADSVGKLLTFLQCGWLVVQSIGRAITHLPITPFELSTLALTCSALCTLGFWWNKPLDVRTPIVLHTNSTIADILCGAGEAAKDPFMDTPLDFVEGRIYMSSKWSRHVLRWILQAGLQKRPLDRIPDDRDIQANLKQHAVLAIGTAAFASIHLCGWTFEFAVRWEQIL
ncbi:uncharacterized protein MYCFIDRAFT_211918 [Pseudocercospora fijiensis CIRAD86]|uniref:Uncharacterized protein n=1 Tax=Pseudocercospora fijiensis (strain CIRAD86) TaxID=383855 RepID=M2YQF2_PSEFD|nr:uncharacterized protein MYCFIDRAFT_211918 [Pseudocercospora fijiensis CIRAD86]EME79955.1 hypothetical protein MYCFIDRAFT_211918 [Pseudocercospora fijiensis CIRAD86]